MKRIRDLTFFEIKDRIDFLSGTRDKIVEYFNDTEIGYGLHIIEGKKASKIRSGLNMEINKAREYVLSSGVSTSLFYAPPPAIGGIQGNIDLFNNIFNLSRFEIDSQQIKDMIERSVGNYQNEKRPAILRTFNPFWWLFRLTRSIAAVPFWMLKEAGINTTRFEKSIPGKLIKLVFDAVVFLAALLGVLKAFGFDEQFITFCKHIL